MSEPEEGGGGEETGIRVNERELSVAEVAGLQTRYGVPPVAGEYWYDARSGMYGVIGQAGTGFMLPGHEFGPLERRCSGGRTGVLVNGRELPQLEWMIWSRVLGAAIHPGSYWLDADGNAGIEGSSVPAVNFVQSAARRGPVGADNFWSARFGAGDHEADNQRGYVTVPGHGPVAYGF